MVNSGRQLRQNRPSNSSRGPQATALMVACCLLSIISMTVWVREGESGVLHRTRDTFSVITAPIQSLGYSMTTPARALSHAFDSNDLSASEIDAILAENAHLRSEVIRLQEYEQESKRLSDLMDIVDVYGLESVGARVISRSTDPWNRTIIINKGTAAGVRVGMPVMSVNGIIGRVESSGSSSSVVRLITDQNSSVAVFLQGSRTDGMLVGSPDGTLYLRYIGLDTFVEPGMTVVTSGLGGVYPKGIPVGTVQSVEWLPSDIYRTIVVKPLDRSGSFEEVLVITGSESNIRPGSGGTQENRIGMPGQQSVPGRPQQGCLLHSQKRGALLR